MNKKRFSKKIILIPAAVILLFAALAAMFILRNWIDKNPCSVFSLEDTTYASRDSLGNTYVIGDSGTSLIKLDPSGNVTDRFTCFAGDFVSPAEAVADNSGNIYVHDVQIESGVRIDSETILRISEKDHQSEIIKTIDAPEGTVRRAVIGLFPQDNGIFYAVKNSGSIAVYNTESYERLVFPITHAEELVLSAAYDSKNNDLYYSTYSGKIMKFAEGADDILLYNSDSDPESVPQYISFNDGILYCNDIGKRDILAIDTTSFAVDRFDVGGEKSERSIDTNLSAANSLVSVSSLAVTFWGPDRNYEMMSEAGFAKNALFKCTVVFVAILYSILFAAVIIVLLIRYILLKSSGFTKAALAIASMVLILSLLFIGTLFPELNTQVTEEIYSREMLAANVINNSIPMDSFLRLNKPSDFMNEDYKAVRKAVHDVFFMESDDSKDLYCVLYKVIDGTVTLTYTMEDICVVYPYDWEYEDSDYQAVMEGGETLTTSESSSAGSFVYVNAPLIDENGDIQGMIEIGTDLHSVNERNNNILLSLSINILAIMVVSFMFMIEFLYFIRGHRSYEFDDDPPEKKKIPVEIFRFVVFVIFFFASLTCAILPIYAVKLAEELAIPGVSPVMMAALPISIEIISGAVFSMLGGPVIDKLGARKTVIYSCILFTAGLAMRVVPNIIVLSLSGILVGAGKATLLILVNVLIAMLPDEEKDRGYAYYSVSALSSINCAAVFGGFMIQWMPYWALFAVTAVLSITLYFVCIKYLNHELPEEGSTEESEGEKGNLFKFLLNPSVLTFFAFIMIPLLVCGYFVNYLFPILGAEWGLSETYISYAFILNGLVILITGTPVSAFMSNHKIKNVGLFLSALIYAGGFLLVAVFQNIPALLTSVFILGLAESFSIMLPAYFTDLKIVEKFGFDRALGIYSLLENASESVSSFIFSIAFVVGLKEGLMTVIYIIAALALVFLIGSFVFGRKETVENKTE